MAISVGDVIGEYEVIGELGAGGIGKVYKVRHSISHRVEALKLLRPDQLEHPEMADRFVKEIRVLASLNHSNIASLHTAFRHDDVLLMTMEYVEGETLAHRLHHGKVDMWTGLTYISQVLQALLYAHERGVIHRDIKPSNIMIAAHNRIKLLDFGLAVSELDTERSRSGSIVGSLHYMSPEQVRGLKVDARSDLYSVGVTLYELLTGQLPIRGNSQYEIMDGHLRQIPIPPRELNPSIPADLAGLVMMAMRKEPGERIASAQEFLRQLDAIQLESTIAIPASGAHYAQPDAATRTIAAGAMQSVSSTSVPPVAAAPTRAPKTDSSSIHGHLPDAIALITKQLAVYVGPIARVLVKKAAKQCADTRDIYDKVAAEIESPADQQKFLAQKPRR
ncbi:MAG TPA: serine/threonine-protein kinase [Terriglobales bacterium]|nr:serine/threonine-protein kinase [Terriglobales bacterium]